MKIFVRVKAGKKIDQVEDLGDNNFLVTVKALPVRGLANQAVIKVLAEYFNVNRSRISLLSGVISKIKVFEICPADNFSHKKTEILEDFGQS